MDLVVPVPLPKNDLEEIIDKAKDWALMHGMCMRSKVNFNRDSLQFAPFILIPSSFPRSEFEKACQIQTVLNLLIHRVAYSYNFLKETLAETVKADSFTNRLFSIYETVYKEGFTQKVSLGLLRSDLMLDTSCPDDMCITKRKPYCCWKQVEINTIASGFGWLGPVSMHLHKYVLTELGYADKLINLPENKALEGICSSMLEAWKKYDDPKAIILFIIEDVTYNICDQRFHEFEIRRQNPNVKVIRRTLTQLSTSAKLGPNKELIVDDYTVAFVYFRSGYEPKQYPTEKEWEVRLLIERSSAIKCPSIQYHLAGTKKVQQALARPHVVAQLLQDEEADMRVKEIFTGLYPLDFDERGNMAVEMAVKNPENFVLKPQREGGCNNIYGSEIRTFLESIKDKQDRAAWILMEKINPPVQQNYMIRPGDSSDITLQSVNSELGIFGAILGDEKDIFVNKQVGHMLRTKFAHANEGGVATGAGACDSVYLID